MRFTFGEKFPVSFADLPSGSSPVSCSCLAVILARKCSSVPGCFRALYYLQEGGCRLILRNGNMMRRFAGLAIKLPLHSTWSTLLTRTLPLSERRRRPRDVLPKKVCDDTRKGRKLFDLVCAHDLEGVVAKRLKDPYGPRVKSNIHADRGLARTVQSIGERAQRR
jgi:hypothetical protein